MKRGEVVVAAGGGGFGGKPRPFVVLQSEAYRAGTLILAGCHGLDDERVEIRPLLMPTAENGLKKISEVTIDTLVTMRLDRISQVIGHLSDAELDEIDSALIVLLGLAEAR